MNISFFCFLSTIVTIEMFSWLNPSKFHLGLYLCGSAFVIINSLIPLLLREKENYFFSSQNIEMKECKIGLHLTWIVIICLSIWPVYQYSHLILSYTYDHKYADMITNIQFALRKTFLGEGMYGLIWTPWIIPIGYMPLHNLSFAPAFFLNWDIRIMGLIYYSTLFIIIAGQIHRFPKTKVTFMALITLVLFFGYSQTVTGFLPIAHTPVIWLLAFIFCNFVYQNNFICASLTLVALLHTRETSLFVAIAYIIYLFRSFGFTKSLYHTVLILGLTFVIWLPFFDTEGIIYLIQYKLNAPVNIWNSGKRLWIINTLGFSNLAFILGWHGYLKVIASLGILVIFLWQYLSKRLWTKKAFYYVCGLSLLWFYYHAGIPFKHIYITVIMFWFFGTLESVVDQDISQKMDMIRSPPVWNVKNKFSRFIFIVYALFVCAIIVFTTQFQNPTKYYFARQKTLLLKGFYEPEKSKNIDFVWAGKGPHEFCFELNNILLDKALFVPFEFLLKPFLCGKHREQSISISINDYFVDVIKLCEGWQSYRVNIPAKYLRIGINKCTIFPSRFISPKACGRHKDSRKLSIAYGEMRILLPQREGDKKQAFRKK